MRVFIPNNRKNILHKENISIIGVIMPFFIYYINSELESYYESAEKKNKNLLFFNFFTINVNITN